MNIRSAPVTAKGHSSARCNLGKGERVRGLFYSLAKRVLRRTSDGVPSHFNPKVEEIGLELYNMQFTFNHLFFFSTEARHYRENRLQEF